MSEIKTVSDLIRAHKDKHPNSHYFDRDTLKFFGERLSEMRLLKKHATIQDAVDIEHDCYVISSIQHPGRPLKPRRTYHYFDVNTLEDIHI